jgi:hypothetical protein
MPEDIYKLFDGEDEVSLLGVKQNTQGQLTSSCLYSILSSGGSYARTAYVRTG